MLRRTHGPRNLTRLLALLSFGAACMLFGRSALFAEDPTPPDGPAIYRVEITGAISPSTLEILEQAIETAEEANASALLVVLDTHGGLMSSMDDMIRDILASKVPVITYVGPPGASCGSAGVFILYASHLAAMAPATNIGSATPISMGSGGREGDDDRIPETAGADDELNLKRKLLNHSRAQITSLAEYHGRDVNFAVRTITHAENITSTEAFRIGAVDLLAENETELIQKANGRQVRMPSGRHTLELVGLPVVNIEHDFRSDVLSILTDPSVAYILFSLGMIGILAELYYPGSIFPGVVGAICLILGLYSMQSLSVDYTGFALIGLSVVFFILELHVPSYGMLSVAGLGCFVLGSLMLVRSGDEFLGTTLSVAITTSLLMGGVMALIAYKAAQAHRAKRVSGFEKMLEETGVVREAVSADDGSVFVHSEIWQARTGGAPIAVGTRVRVVGKDGLVLRVEPA